MLRSTRRPRAFAAIVQLSLAFVAAPAAADVEGIRLTYGADAGCPDASRFVQAVAARTDRIRRAADGEEARAFVVEITREASGVRGTLSIKGLDGLVSRREITGESCEEVVSALALVTALAIDPLASTGPEPSVAAGSSSSGAAQDVSPALPPLNATESASPPAHSVPANGVRWALGAEAQSAVGLVPGWGGGGGGFVDVTGSPSGHLIPSLRVSVFAMTTRVAFAGAVGARLEWFVARIEACPLRFAWTSNLGLSVCGALDAGALRSTGIGLKIDGTEIRPWLAPAALGRVGWSPGGAFFVEGGGGLTAPATRYSFYVEQSGRAQPPLQRIRPLAPVLEVDAGYRFP